MTQKIIHPRFLNLLLLEMPIAMAFLVPPPLTLLFFLYVLLVHPSLHHILK
jgi:hypothetical protein